MNVVIMKKEALSAGIKSFKNQAIKLDERLHTLAVSALYYMNQPEIQDTGYAQRLIDALGKATRNETLKAWFMLHGKCTIKDGIVTFRKSKHITPENWEIKTLAAAELPFWVKAEVSAETQLREMDAEAMFISLFKRMASADKLVHPELFNKVWEVLPDTVKNKVMA